ncbi:hypothetical protein C2845_PM13G06130 [Panicum miliaceum]|uniref:Uncharacterized protein n=1 Tax=Panicum miliaceum TaxID=4540 RepID=A0A3L6RIM7_PANMI|nr:hypothetical protein C2845_PM13G06130 [Panicum miliaceum]
MCTCVRTCKQVNQTVSDILSGGLRQHLVPRLTLKAQSELAAVTELLSQVTLGLTMPADLAIGDVHKLPCPDTLPVAHFDTFILLCCWHLWKRRMASSFGKKR